MRVFLLKFWPTGAGQGGAFGVSSLGFSGHSAPYAHKSES